MGAIFADLIQLGIIPGDADYGDGVVAQYVWLSDGMPWFDDHVLPLLEPASAIRILDVYHVLERLRTYVRKVCGKAKTKAGKLAKKVTNLVLGKCRRRSSSSSRRGGPRPKRRRQRKTTGRFDAPSEGLSYPAHVLNELERLHIEATGKCEDNDDKVDELLDYLGKYVDRIDYRDYARRGLQIGSGAMESLHRSASQVRTKVPGARWLAETSQAVFDLRMLRIVGNWTAFWNQSNLRCKLVDAFAS